MRTFFAYLLIFLAMTATSVRAGWLDSQPRPHPNPTGLATAAGPRRPRAARLRPKSKWSTSKNSRISGPGPPLSPHPKRNHFTLPMVATATPS